MYLRHGSQRAVAVEVFAPVYGHEVNVRDDPWSLALSQRDFGPRRLLVAFADRDGQMVCLAHARRTDPLDLALKGCISFALPSAVAAVAFCDEPVNDGPPPADTAARFAALHATAGDLGMHLVDWFSCDDDLFRSARFSIGESEWWDVPAA